VLAHIREQVDYGISIADVIIFVVNIKDGLTTLDREIADMLRKSKKPIVLAINKADNYLKDKDAQYEFFELGFENIYLVSGVNKTGIGDMLDKVVSYFDDSIENDDDSITKVAIIGRPNAGKSQLLNNLLGEKRVIVSDIAGTTRDAIDTSIVKNDKKYTFIDTAGLRRKSKITDNIEIYSYMRSEIAIDRCDIAIVMIDANEGISNLDEKIAGMAVEKGKGVIIAINKWDLIEKSDRTTIEWEKDIKEKFAFMASYEKHIFISALTGQRVERLYKMIDEIRENQLRDIKTGVLNEILIDAMAVNDTPQDKGKKLKIYYITKSGVTPPTFVLFVNDKNIFHFSYLRYIENKLRESFDFSGTPIKFIIRERKDNDNR
ncbi:MAG: ribosome biogenesis GTPase Der, partial [Lachnospiraceae bacterium]|nr:ribosome biogenesis GTPase Der [Lachnospiraceae bacterium]